MRIVIEAYPYPQERLKEIVPPQLLDLPDKKGVIRPQIVGYCFNPHINDCVFFLPKVVLTKDKDDQADVTGKGLVLGHYDPLSLLDGIDVRSDADRKFLQQFSIWIYRAINVFYRDNDTSIVARQTLSDVDGSPRTRGASIIDAVLSVIRFAREEKDFVMFEIRNIHGGHQRVNWRKTIAHQTPVMQKKSPLYLTPVNKKRQIDFDEELLVIFFSILEYIRRQYGFSADINCNYETIEGARFANYLHGFGCRRLRQIKYKYFSDKALKLWSVCYAFFENAERLHSSRNAEDYLLARSFDRVFETIVDTLLGEDAPRGFKEQRDRKVVDHLYTYQALINPTENIYYIADSKYYKVGSPLDAGSIYKQYTYARNVIQQTLDIKFGKGTLAEKRKKGYLPYRDELTEGYNVTPNFFISAKIESERSGVRYSYESDNLSPHDVDEAGRPLLRHRSIQFENRIFDRDTLILSHYDINFLYLIALYGKDDRFEQGAFRSRARKQFRDYLIRLIDRYYQFYRISPADQTIDEFVTANFKTLAGKLFSYDGCLVIGLERDNADSTDFIDTFVQTYKAALSPLTLM